MYDFLLGAPMTQEGTEMGLVEDNGLMAMKFMGKLWNMYALTRLSYPLVMSK